MEGISAALAIAIVLAAFALFVLVKTAVVVPQQSAYVVERLGQVTPACSTPASTSWCRSWT